MGESMTTIRKVRWIGYGMAVVGWIVVGLDLYKIGPLAHASGTIRILPFVLAFVGHTLNLVGGIKENKMKGLEEQSEAMRLEHAK